MAYQAPCEYERMAKLAIDVYIDYNLNKFPVYSKDVARMMGFEFIYYSDLNLETRTLMKRFSDDGVNYPHMSNSNCIRTIYINDLVDSEGRKDASGFHEIKHILDYDCETDDEKTNEKNEDLANYFAKYMKCPFPYLIYYGYDNEYDVMTKFGVSQQMAQNVLKTINSRTKAYGDAFFEYEVPLLELLLGDKLDKSSLKIINRDTKGDDVNKKILF